MFQTTPTPDCLKWREDLLDGVSPQDVGFLHSRLDELDQKKGYVASNSWLRGSVERYQLLNQVSIMRPAIEAEANRIAEDEGNKAALEWLRRTVKRLRFVDSLITDLNGEELTTWAEEKSRLFSREYEDLKAGVGDQAATAYMKTTLKGASLAFKGWRNKQSVEGLAKRMATKEWWIRQAKRQFMTVENVLRECGKVKKYTSPYVSSWALNKFRQQQQSNRKFLESWEAVNDLGQAFTLDQLSKKGVSNPANRVAEMAVRSRGFKELAEEMGHDAFLLTLTAPSKYHATSGGKRNPKFYQFGCPSPRDAHQYLCNVWKRFRSWCKREKIPFYGLRTVEPHADGCPHWHLVVFVDPDHAKPFLDKFKEYALKEDGDENGAEKRRFTIVKNDPKKGSIIGYVLKYIQKNITGEYIDLDHEAGKSGQEGAARAVAWARMHRIRQFQFFGGVSVTVWRELRRLGISAAPSACLNIYHAANRADWKQFVQLMGGVFAGRNQKVKPSYSDDEQNQFGEFVEKLKGVVAVCSGEYVKTRLYEWTVQRIGQGALSLKSDEVATWTRVNNCTGGGSSPPNYH